MKAVRRLLLVILGLLMIGTGFFLLLEIFYPLGRLSAIFPGFYRQDVVFYAGGALLLLGFIPLVLGVSPSKKKPETVLQTGALGEVRISLLALENMVLRVVQQMRGIRDSSRRVTYTPQGLVVYLHVKVLPDQKLPDLTSELQNNVKNYLEETTGIIVNEVIVSVENIILDQVPVKVK
ncbi:MAG TPA: alkaline shock response membrane anchor protein AmaP [Bacillota bacterium]|jgi:hypothetical protein|nr:alkaline shock response membrane anchor protein AmaP [Bacillota bacterium]HOA35308.1 alkaline shock response membrane anchor protein AmaP [Bacillota bacterium]HOJ83394.1 alkaline shock response membrane anchor protein AmaP [Bacillota bacterium]HOL14766.1 alkaline shock response membrane anchor protein AmaP [Bacillota bacterium]HPZ11008.1 alkaline shock response membrane anchor protein AmaP [Bacillota bacterium]